VCARHTAQVQRREVGLGYSSANDGLEPYVTDAACSTDD